MQATLKVAIQHHSKGELALSEAMYRSVLKEFPNQPEALHFLGLAIHQAGRSEEAVKLLRKAVEIKPDYDAAFGNLGNALVGLERYDEYRGSLHDLQSSLDVASGDWVRHSRRHLRDFQVS